MGKFVLTGAFVVLSALFPASAQNPPIGNPVWNQATHLVAVTTSDTATIPPTRALFIGASSSCNLVVLGYSDQSPTTTVTFNNVQAGQLLPISVVQVKATGTNCTGIVALY